MVDISQTDITFQNVYTSPYAPKEDDFREANLLMLPYQSTEEEVEYYFPEHAGDFLQYVVSSSPDGVKADIATNDEAYLFMEKHSSALDIGMVLVSEGIVSIALGLLTNFIYDKLKSMHRDSSSTDIKVTIISESSKHESTQITYEGPADGFREVVKTASELHGD